MEIAIFRALQLGDLLCTVPAFRALRAAYPTARITLIGLPWAKEFVARFSKYLDIFIWFPGYESLPEQPYIPTQTNEFINLMRSRNIDLLIQMHGNGTIVNSLLEKCGPKKLVGFGNSGVLYPNQGPEIYRHLHLLEYLGIEPKGDELEFPLTQQDYTDFANLQLPIKHKQYVVIHTGARDPLRRWDQNKFVELAKLCHNLGYQIVLTGTESERTDVDQLSNKIPFKKVVNAAGKTTLATVAVLLEQSKLVITNDTGISHLADAIKKASLIISLGNEGDRWSPLNRNLHRVIDGHQPQAMKQVKHEISHLLA